jgi:hypothetical protein
VFTHEPWVPEDEGVFEQVYQLGIDSQLPEALTCSPYPYPSRSRIRAALTSQDSKFLVYADGDLRMAFTFNDEGVITFCISKPWLSSAQIAAGRTHPNGLAQAAYSYDLVRSLSGGVVKSYNNSSAPSILALHSNNHITVIELDEFGRETGREIQH